MAKYAEIALPDLVIPNRDTLTYDITKEMDCAPGDTVHVPLRNKYHIGVVINIHEKKPQYAVRPIEKKHIPKLLLPWQVNVAKKIAEYYMAPLGSALSLFLPQFIFKKTETPCDAKKNGTRKKKIQFLQIENTSEKPLVYASAIEKAIRKGKQALLILPDIAAISFFLPLFQKRFKEKLAIYCSGLSQTQRRDAFWKIAQGHVQVILGTRGALYAPVRSLSLVILDDEEEEAYKEDRKPHCHARNVVEYIAQCSGANIIIGSEAPSLEAWRNIQEKKWQKIERIQRKKSIKMTVIDMREERKKGNVSPLSDTLVTAIAQAKEQHEQAIFFLNKRGEASAAICMDCGNRAMCPLCNTTLTFYGDMLRCHRCTFVRPNLTFCPICKGVRIRFSGYGTQAIERLLSERLPNLRIAAFDRDIIKKPAHAEAVIAAFQKRTVDVLVGTTLLTSYRYALKAPILAFIHAELGTNIPNFRAGERIFQKLQKLTQNCVAENGHIILQTYEPDLPLIQAVIQQKPEILYTEEANVRKRLNYPPYGEFAKIRLQHRKREILEREAKTVEKMLRSLNQKTTKIDVLCMPGTPLKKRGLFQWNIFIKGKAVQEMLKKLPTTKMTAIDVDPTDTC